MKGIDAVNAGAVFAAGGSVVRVQSLYLSSDLFDAGWRSGAIIRGITINVEEAPLSSISDFTIAYGFSSITSLSDFQTGLLTVCIFCAASFAFIFSSAANVVISSFHPDFGTD